MKGCQNQKPIKTKEITNQNQTNQNQTKIKK